MAREESFIERLIPGDLEHQIPAAVQRALPGGFRNRIVQAGLGLLITFGFAFLVRRWLEKREANRQALTGLQRPPGLPPAPPPLAPHGEPQPQQAVALPMHQAPDPPAPPSPPPPLPASGGRAGRYPLLAQPHVRLAGPIDDAMYASFREQLAKAPGDGALVISLSTLGGDPEVARLMGDEVRLLREYSGRELLFLGKVAVYSAGAIFMASFPAGKRFLTRGTRILIHERQMARTVDLSGPLHACSARLKRALNEIEESIRIEEEGFRAMIAGSRVTFEELAERAPSNWYMDAIQARDLGLVLDVI